MKDMYSFDKSVEDAFATYDQVGQAYTKIFQRIGIPFVVAEADSGNIGGSKSHEYHLISSVGEDTLLTCNTCGYTANEELAEAVYNENNTSSLPTVSTTTNDYEIALQSLGLQALTSSTPHITTLAYSAYDGTTEEKKVDGLIAVLTPHHRSANLLKVHAALGKHLEGTQTIGDRATLEFNILSATQWMENKDQGKPVHLFLDDAVKHDLPSSSFSSFTIHDSNHFRLAQAGDDCQRCKYSSESSSLESVKAIEVAHTFYLGTKYSSVLGCTFQDHTRMKDTEMGCYGIGISRLLATVAESKTDDRGLVWPSSIAPYKACIIATDDKRETFKTLANKLYDQINGTPGWTNNIVLDDRRTGFGRKMTDAEMIGFPWIVVIGRKAFNEQEPLVEIHQRIQGAPNVKIDVPLQDLVRWLMEH
ncbi:uncharacterized protein BX664DRAFT_264257 [Halteromyces radiatus]|uniref:uncharacterized protein n=1 Tax=Halteromyces radiatus TaxID=101107 RepID=UPI002220E132|nr:uncharacterized protein BX664DRAFT_264257 [Halteromyces radiatus]KAI8089603.1 hypothetical protein BX664DRAFT_264257 [Halteromyces radiatus]